MHLDTKICTSCHWPIDNIKQSLSFSLSAYVISVGGFVSLYILSFWEFCEEVTRLYLVMTNWKTGFNFGKCFYPVAQWETVMCHLTARRTPVTRQAVWRMDGHLLDGHFLVNRLYHRYSITAGTVLSTYCTLKLKMLMFNRNTWNKYFWCA